MLIETIDMIPPLKELQKYPSEEALKFVLDEKSPLIFPLLSWIIKSNRTHLELLPKEKQFKVKIKNLDRKFSDFSKKMRTELQFMVVNSFPEH
jgi:hypothetical protein